MLNLLSIIGLVVLVLSLAALLAPLEAFMFWAGWGKAGNKERLEMIEPAQSRDVEANEYVIFLDGISKGSKRDLDAIIDFLESLKKAMPEACIIDDVIPYSVFNRPLTDKRRPLYQFWQWVEEKKFNKNPIGYLINIRNVFQVMVSADWRYSLIYNIGMTKLLLKYLIKHGYNPNSKVTVTIIGYSGGGQVAAGCASLIGQCIETPVTVVSIGGVVAGNTDLRNVKKWYQIISDKDPVERIGAIIFPLRWPIFWFSRWNKAKREGKIEIVRFDGATHNGENCYMDKNCLIDGTQSQLDKTVEFISKNLSKADVV